jgi:hypothetical protein
MQAPTTDEPAPQPAPDRGVDVLRAEQREVALDDVDLAEVDEVAGLAVDDEEREPLAHLAGVHDHRRVQPHLPGQLQRGPLGQLVQRYRQGEAHLDHAVAGGVPVRPHDPARAVHLAHDEPSPAGVSRRSVAGL